MEYGMFNTYSDRVIEKWRDEKAQYAELAKRRMLENISEWARERHCPFAICANRYELVIDISNVPDDFKRRHIKVLEEFFEVEVLRLVGVDVLHLIDMKVLMALREGGVDCPLYEPMVAKPMVASGGGTEKKTMSDLDAHASGVSTKSIAVLSLIKDVKEYIGDSQAGGSCSDALDMPLFAVNMSAMVDTIESHVKSIGDDAGALKTGLDALRYDFGAVENRLDGHEHRLRNLEKNRW
jgi:hypothetical protein